MKKKKIKIIFTGGTGRFGKIFRQIKTNYDLYFPTRKQFDITNFKKLENYTKSVKPKFLIHAAALSRPMEDHDKHISKSIDTNIIGTSNIVKICSKFKIKLIYFSTNYVYPAKAGNYTEKDPVLPHNKYGWSKLGGEAAVHMYKNSLILRICMTERPFAYGKAFANMKTNFIFHEDFIKIFKKIIHLKGIINVGGPTMSVYSFAKKYNKNIKKKYLKKEKNSTMPLNASMNLMKMRKLSK